MDRSAPGARRRLYQDLGLSGGLTINAPISPLGTSWMERFSSLLVRTYLGELPWDLTDDDQLWFLRGGRMYQDLSNARAMYGQQHQNADRIARQIMTWNLPAIVALVAANCAAVYTIDNPTIAVALGNIIGASITYLWNERSQVVGFFFGSSMGSKDKQEMLRRDA